MRSKEAVEETVAMWIWLRDNPTKNKIDYFEKMEEDYPNMPWPQYDCFLCEIWHNECFIPSKIAGIPHTPVFTSNCPLSNKELHCDTGNDPYSLWDTDSNYHDPEQAQKIIDACNLWLQNNV